MALCQHIESIFTGTMSEKLCLQWNDFQDNVKSAFGNLRESLDFVDVTLACEDGHQVEAHKVILAAASPFFQSVFKTNKHSHPLIFMRGVKSEVLLALLDFLYFGEANIFQEHLDSFLAIAEELQLKGLMGTNNDETMANNPVQNEEGSILEPPIRSKSNVEKHKMTHKTFSGTVALTSDHSVDLQGLDVRGHDSDHT